MRAILFLAFFIISSAALEAQTKEVSGKVLNERTGVALPFANVQTNSENETLTNIEGSFDLKIEENTGYLLISYPGFFTKKINIYPSEDHFYEIGLLPVNQPKQQSDYLISGENPARNLIERAIERKSQNDPEKVFSTFRYKSYNKILIDKQSEEEDLSSSEMGRSFLSEKVSEHVFEKFSVKKEIVTGISTPGFEEPVFEVLSLNVEAVSLYDDDYPIYQTKYAGPLGKKAFKNYTYAILDTVETQGRAGYMIYFQPKRPRVVAGWQGVLFLDTITLAVQRAKTQHFGTIKVEVDQNFEYYEKEDIWFPVAQRVILKPGTGGEDITTFGGSISLGTVQRKNSILNWVMGTGKVEKDLQMVSTTTNFDIEFNKPVETNKYTPAVKILDDADEKSEEFWMTNRKEPFTTQDEQTGFRVKSVIENKNINRKIEVLYAILNGYYPVGFWDFDLSNFVKYNNYEGFRLGAGGRTNNKFAENFRLEGYLVYGFKDRAYKYAIGGGARLNRRSGTWWNVNYSQDIREVGSHEYIRGVKEFSILEPRTANVDYYYSYKTLTTGIEHRLTPRLETEIQLSRSEISQTRDYVYLQNGESYRNYNLAAAKIGFLWRPFSRFISTPDFHQIFFKGYPVITGQVSKSFSGIAGGDFDFTKLGLKVEYQLNRQNLSVTQFTLEGNYGLGELPLTHAFHAFPNNAHKEEILQRFSVAGKISFETMYFNEFFSDKQAAIHIRHQLRPLNISPSLRPEINLISRHVVGDFSKMQAHQNIQFQTLEHIYSEAGFELNKIFLGFGLSAAYRYGAYHLPTFKENFSFKFTFELKI